VSVVSLWQASKGTVLRRRLAEHFDRDPQTNVPWFASPIDIAPPVQKPRHSFTYLRHPAKKRKLELEKEKGLREGEDSRMDVDMAEPPMVQWSFSRRCRPMRRGRER